MNEFAFLADVQRNNGPGGLDLGELSRDLARVPCGPLCESHTYPDAELHAFLASLGDA
ncbi:hypothetical protein R0145_11865 [Raineyella sp. W15-4]|nr:hypothetical protein [Raineyella sp. W15-4]WOQ15910.1 hypothetical protein R0145_11865 [Raineyella sp. W15-4]